MAYRIFVVGARGIPDVEGGAEKNAERLFPKLADKEWDITVAGLRRFTKAREYRGVKLWGAPYLRVLKTDKLAYYLAAIWKALTLRPDIVHLQGLGSALFLWAYWLMGCRTVVRYGSADYVLSKWGRIGKAGFRAAEFQLRFADAVIAVTPSLVSRLNRLGISQNVHLIANARDDSSDYSPEEGPVVDGPYILAVGRVTMQKNVHGLINGFKAFAKHNPDIRLVIAGSMDDARYMRRLKPEIDERIIFLGGIPRSRTGALYRNASLFVNASVHEGHCNAILEAIGWGCPLLLSDIPENRDFDLPEDLYFDACDPSALAAAMRCALANRERFRATSPLLLSWADVADRTERVYRHVMQRTETGAVRPASAELGAIASARPTQ